MNATNHFSGSLALMALVVFSQLTSCRQAKKELAVSLSLIPPGTITNRVNLDIRAGIKNESQTQALFDVVFYLDEVNDGGVLFQTRVNLPAQAAEAVKFVMPTGDKTGAHKIIVTVRQGNTLASLEKKITITASDSARSDRTIGGAWISFYHWSEQEGKKWNPAIKKLTDVQWKEMVGSMHELGMDIIVIQESFRNQEYVGKHKIDSTGYQGKAFYPSKLFPDRMPIAATDPVEAVLSEADRLQMHVFMGVGMYAWFDYTPGSLAWHKAVARELWQMYGHHPSFYGFYVSEEGMGSLDCFETEGALQAQRRREVLDFFKEFTPFCKQLAPDKPVMFAPNGWGVGRAGNAYTHLLQNVDIICPFAFSRMPQGDLSGPEAIDLLQKYCDDADAHLWLDLEAFLFDEKEGYLYPRPMGGIKRDLVLYDNFEKVICYQYPGVFSDPKMSAQVGEASTIRLFGDYTHYLDSLNNK